MLDSNSAQINRSGFEIEIEGVNSSCNSAGICPFTPTTNDSSLVVRFHALVVFNGTVHYTDTNVTVNSSVIALDVGNCD